MRLKEDRYSYRAQGVIARDARHDRSAADPTRTDHRRQNRRRWCKGRVGVEHAPVWQRDRKRAMTTTGQPWMTYACTNCGKELDSWCGDWWRKNPRPAPVDGSTDPLPRR